MRDGVLFWPIFGLVAVFVVMSWVWVPTLEWALSPFHTQAATTTVTVTASVTAAIECSTDESSTDFQTLTSSVITTSSPNASTTMSCINAGGGCTLYIKDAGDTSDPGLWNSTSSELIESPNLADDATTTLSAGTEGFGIRVATTTVGTGATLGVTARYNVQAELSGSVNDIGGLEITNQVLASTTASSSAREVVVTHKAAISGGTPGGAYNDTITYSCTAN